MKVGNVDIPGFIKIPHLCMNRLPTKMIRRGILSITEGGGWYYYCCPSDLRNVLKGGGGVSCVDMAVVWEVLVC